MYSDQFFVNLVAIIAQGASVKNAFKVSHVAVSHAQPGQAEQNCSAEHSKRKTQASKATFLCIDCEV